MIQFIGKNKLVLVDQQSTKFKGVSELKSYDTYKELIKDILFKGGLDCLKELEEVIIPEIRRELQSDEDDLNNYDDDVNTSSDEEE